MGFEASCFFGNVWAHIRNQLRESIPKADAMAAGWNRTILPHRNAVGIVPASAQLSTVLAETWSGSAICSAVASDGKTVKF